MSGSPVEELALLIRSGWRAVAFESFEEDRALALLERAAKSLERACVPWSLASGLAGDERSAGSLDAGLRARAEDDSEAWEEWIQVPPENLEAAVELFRRVSTGEV